VDISAVNRNLQPLDVALRLMQIIRFRTVEKTGILAARLIYAAAKHSVALRCLSATQKK
jgi:hypothetical protein